MHSVSRVGSLVDAARLVLEGLVLFWLEVKVGRSSTMVGLLAILVPTGCLIARSLMAMPLLAGRAVLAGRAGPGRAVKMLVPVVMQGRREHLALLGIMACSSTNPAQRRGRKDGGCMLTRLASPQLLRIDKRLTEAADVGEVESDLRRGDVLGQSVNFVLETIPLKGLLDLAVEAGDNPIELGTDMWVDSSRRETGEIVEQDVDALAPSMKCA